MAPLGGGRGVSDSVRDPPGGRVGWGVRGVGAFGTVHVWVCACYLGILTKCTM